MVTVVYASFGIYNVVDGGGGEIIVIVITDNTVVRVSIYFRHFQRTATTNREGTPS